MTLLVDLGKNFGVADEEVLFLANLDRVTAPAGKEDLITTLDRGGDNLAVLVGSAWTSGDNACFRKRRRGSGGGNKEAGGGLGLGLESLYENAVEERDDRLDGSDCGLSSLQIVKESVGSCGRRQLADLQVSAYDRTAQHGDESAKLLATKKDGDQDAGKARNVPW